MCECIYVFTNLMNVCFAFDIRYVGFASLILCYSKHIFRHSDHVFNTYMYMKGDMLRLCLMAAILEFGLWLGAAVFYLLGINLIRLAHVGIALNRLNA